MVHPESRKSPISNNETCSLRKAAFVKLIKGQLASNVRYTKNSVDRNALRGKIQQKINNIFHHAAKAAV